MSGLTHVSWTSGYVWEAARITTFASGKIVLKTIRFKWLAAYCTWTKTVRCLTPFCHWFEFESHKQLNNGLGERINELPVSLTEYRTLAHPLRWEMEGWIGREKASLFRTFLKVLLIICDLYRPLWATCVYRAHSVSSSTSSRYSLSQL